MFQRTASDPSLTHNPRSNCTSAPIGYGFSLNLSQDRRQPGPGLEFLPVLTIIAWTAIGELVRRLRSGDAWGGQMNKGVRNLVLWAVIAVALIVAFNMLHGHPLQGPHV